MSLMELIRKPGQGARKLSRSLSETPDMGTQRRDHLGLAHEIGIRRHGSGAPHSNPTILDDLLDVVVAHRGLPFLGAEVSRWRCERRRGRPVPAPLGTMAGHAACGKDQLGLLRRVHLELCGRRRGLAGRGLCWRFGGTPITSRPAQSEAGDENQCTHRVRESSHRSELSPLRPPRSRQRARAGARRSRADSRRAAGQRAPTRRS